MRAESINFTWKSLTFKTGSLRWANTPEEVPLSDVTRGYPLTQNPLWAVPPWENRHYEIRSAPKSGYPRIVRCNLFEPGYIAQQDAPNVLSELRNVEKYIFSGRQKNTDVKKRELVLELAEKYGPPYHEDENTLESWLGLAAKVHWHFWTHKVLQDDGWLALEGEVRSALQKYGLDSELKSDVDESYFVDSDRLLPHHRINTNYLLYEREELKVLYLLKRAFHLLAQKKRWKDTEEFRHTMARLVSPHITKHMQGSRSSTRPYLELSYGRLGITCSIGVWTDFKLAELWRNNLWLKVCINCGRPFVPKRPHANYCTKGGGCISTVPVKRR